MIDHWKPLGGFIENTIRPLLGELHWFFEECDKRGIPLTENSIKAIAEYVASRWFEGLIIRSIVNIIISLIIGYVVCLIYL